MRRRTLSLLLALMLTAQLVLPAAAEAVELQSTEETVVQELPEEQTEETEATTEETEEATEVPEETEEPAETEETEAPTEEAEPAETEETVEETTEETVEEVEANEAADGFELDAKTGTITKYTGNSSVVEIPEEVGGVKVLAIGSGTFKGNSTLKEVVIPDTVTTIGSEAFHNCVNLRSVTLSKRLESLGTRAFENCAALTSIEIPKSLTKTYSSGTYFVDCGNLSKVTFEEGITKISEGLFRKCPGLMSIDIPDSVITIGAGAFQGSALENVTLHDGLQTVEANVFNGTKLTSVILPDTVVTVGAEAFHNCTNLKTIRLSKRLKSLGSRAFENCASLTAIEIPKSLTQTYAGTTYFVDCGNLSKVTFEKGITEIPAGLFHKCPGLTSVDIPDSVKTIGAGAFQGSALEEVTLYDGLQTIDSNAFYGTKLTDVTLPDTVLTIGSEAFHNCTNLKTIRLSKRLKSLGSRAFENCASLTAIEIPKSLTQTYAGTTYFVDCGNLSKVTFEKGITEIPAGLFHKCPGLTSVDIPDSVKTIGAGAFQGSALEEVTFHDGLQTIDSSAFYGTKLTNVALPDTVLTIGSEAFHNCTNLKTIHLSKRLKSLGSRAFENCAALAAIEIPKSLTQTYGSTTYFVGCGSLSKVTFEEGATQIPAGLFQKCTGFTTITLPTGVTSIGSNAFASTTLEEITIPATVTTIASNAFNGLTSLTVYGSAGSAAETMAKEKGYTFVNIGTPVASITLDPSSVSLEPKQTVQLTATVTPDGATNKALTWSSSDQGVASVDTNGLVTANKSGKATIQAEATDGSGVYGTCEVTVACVHVSDEGTVVKQPSCSEEGLKRYSCVKCGETLREEPLPKTDHDFYRSETEYDEKGNPYYILNCWNCDETREEHDRVLWVSGPDIKYLTSGKSVTFEAKFGDGKNHPVKWSLGDGDEKFVKLKVSGSKVTVTAASALKEKEYICLRAESDFDPYADLTDISFDVRPKAEKVTIHYKGEPCEGKTVTVDLNDLMEGETLGFVAQVLPEDAYPSYWDDGVGIPSTIVWTVSDTKEVYGTYELADEKIETWILHAFLKKDAKLGTITLTATDSVTGKKASVKVATTRISTGVDITAPQDFAEIVGGKTMKLSATLEGSPKDKTVVWSVAPEDAAYASVSGTTLKAADVTEAHDITLTASAKDGGGSKSVTVTVLPRVTALGLEAEGETLGSSYTVSINEMEEPLVLRAVALPADGSVTVKWTGMNGSFADFEADGDTLTISNVKKTGTLTLTAQNAEDSRTTKASVKLTFTRHADSIEILDSKGKPLGQQTLTLVGGKSYTFKNTVTNSKDKSLTDKAVVWTVDNTDYASIVNGKLTAKTFAGESVEVRVTAALKSDMAISDTVTVELTPNLKKQVCIYADGSRVDGTTQLYSLGEKTVSLSAQGVEAVTWKTSSKTAATVDGEGQVTFLKAGTVTITATEKGGKTTANVKFKLVNPVEKLEILGGNTVSGGKTLKLTAKLTGAVAGKVTNSKVAWSLRASDKAYASISASGVLTAKKVTGVKEVLVTAASADGIRATCRVTVYPMTTAVRVYRNGANVTGQTLDFEEGMVLEIRNTPASARQSCTAKSNNAGVGVVAQDGSFRLERVSGKTLRSGTKVTVTFTAADGSGKNCKVTVKMP